MSRCTLIGILDDGWSGLSDAARERLTTASVVVGAGRTLDLVRPHLRNDTHCRDMDGALTAVPQWTQAALAEGRPVAILATGDPLGPVGDAGRSLADRRRSHSRHCGQARDHPDLGADFAE